MPLTHEKTQRIPLCFIRSIPRRALHRHLLRVRAGAAGLYHAMNTFLIICGMALLALGVLVLGVALISRKAMPIQPEKKNEGHSNP
jgi:hypothetical protein